MRTLYFDCGMGAAGDMLNAALFDLLDDGQKAAYLENMNSLGIEGLEVHAAPAQKCGITGTHISVLINGAEETVNDVDLASDGEDAEAHHDHDHDHDHRKKHDHDHGDGHHHGHGHEHEHEHDHEHHHHGMSLADVEHVIESSSVGDKVKANALNVYQRIVEAESSIHGAPVEQVHFHEVGTIDAIADVVGFCLLIDMIAPERIVCSPIHVGSGSVRCAHGILPVPAPATAYILKGIPTYGGAVKGELCTPTGAALLAEFAESFGAQPLMSVDESGYGCGTKDFEAANVVRVLLGNAEDAAAPSASQGTTTVAQADAAARTGSAAYGGAADLGDFDDIVSVLECNVDDMTGEEIAYATETLLEAGARDIFTTAIGMKKGRPATKITCLVSPEDQMRFAHLMFENTTTIGVRCYDAGRFTLARENVVRETPFGPVGFKQSDGYGSRQLKPDFDDVRRIAQERGLSVLEVKNAIMRAQ